MRRTVIAGAVLVVVIALPATRRGLSSGLGSVTDGLRTRVAAFRADYSAREAELRERLLPDDAVVDAAARHRDETR